MNQYYLTTKFKILYATISIVSVAILFKISISDYICASIFGTYILFATFKTITGEHIELSVSGIEYHRFGLTFNAKWENLREINLHWFSLVDQEGVFIDHDLIRITEWWTGYYKVYGGWSQKAFIPLSKFSENWRESELGQQIKQYAPHLF